MWRRLERKEGRDRVPRQVIARFPHSFYETDEEEEEEEEEEEGNPVQVEDSREKDLPGILGSLEGQELEGFKAQLGFLAVLQGLPSIPPERLDGTDARSLCHLLLDRYAEQALSLTHQALRATRLELFLQDTGKREPPQAGWAGGSRPHEGPGSINALKETLNILNLDNAEKLTLQKVLEISAESLEESRPHSSADLPWNFLRKVLALNVTARDTRLEPQASEDEGRRDEKKESETHTKALIAHEPSGTISVNPLDVLCALLISSDSFLQQEILLKMSMCQFALPLLLPPMETPQCTLMLWAMRDIVKKWRPTSLVKSFREESLVLTSTPTFSFVRMGRCSLSKSKVLNEFLSPSQQHCDFFIHRDMECGKISRQISDGLVEMAWHFPGGLNSDDFPQPFAVANLRGDVQSHLVQLRFLTKVSSAVFIFIESLSGREYKFLLSWMDPSTQYYFVLESSSTTFMETHHALNQLISGSKNSHVLVKPENKKEFMEILKFTVSKIIDSYSKRTSVSEMAAVARKHVIHVDEDSRECQVGDEISEIILDEARFKKRLNLWKDLAMIERDLFQKESQETSNSEKYKSDLKGLLLDFHQQQYKCKLTDDLIEFVCGLKYLKMTQKHYFLKWMKLNLDFISRKNPAELKRKYSERDEGFWSRGSQEHTTTYDLILDENEKALGFQYFMRELGRFYEAECSVLKEGKVSETQRRFACFPSIAADLMLEGFPLELFDGDAFRVPLQWMTDILTELHNKLRGRSKVMVITVLGEQSTEKSTLLNAMFGLQFAERRGQCTQGALMALLRVTEDMTEELSCDFILLIDTEVSTLDSDQHDDDLVTLAVGLSDLILVNMEKPTEMNILQLVTRAFLRMHITGQKTSCCFVYQNVSAHSWKGKCLLEQLDGMTQAAAESENTGRSIKFSDIADFDTEMHSWTIPGLWLGAPPMAPVNTEYSKKVFELKKSLFESIKSNRKTRKDIPQFAEWLKTLWNAIRRRSSSCSFQSSLKAEAHHQLSVQYSEWDWTFRREVYLWVSEQETTIQNVPLSELDLGALGRELQKKLAFGEQQILENLNWYFESKPSSLYLDKRDFVRSALSLKHELGRYSSQKLQNATHQTQQNSESLQFWSLKITKGKEDEIVEECMQEVLPETIKFEVIWNPERSNKTYRLSFTEAGSFCCCDTNLKFEATAAVTITYQLDSWHKYQNECEQERLMIAGPLFSIQANPTEAVAAVHFPHFLCLDDKNGSQVYVAHLVEGGMCLEKPDLVEPFYAVLRNPSFSPRGVVLRKSFFKRKVKVDAVALLYQVLGLSTPKFHLYLLPNTISLIKAVDEYEEKCPSLRVQKAPATHKPLTIGSSFIVAKLDDVTVCPKELQLKYRDEKKQQQYLELYVNNMQDSLELHVMEKVKNELVWEAYVRQEELKRLEVSSKGGASTAANVPPNTGTPRSRDACVSDSPEQHFVERHREQLIQRTTNVEGVLDMLYGNILNEEQYRRIFSKATNPEKMRELYSLMPGWDNSCKDLLYRALQLKNRFLIGDLECEATE